MDCKTAIDQGVEVHESASTTAQKKKKKPPKQKIKKKKKKKYKIKDEKLYRREIKL